MLPCAIISMWYIKVTSSAKTDAFTGISNLSLDFIYKPLETFCRLSFLNRRPIDSRYFYTSFYEADDRFVCLYYGCRLLNNEVKPCSPFNS